MIFLSKFCLTLPDLTKFKKTQKTYKSPSATISTSTSTSTSTTTTTTTATATTTERYFYVEIDNIASTMRLTWFGIIQGSILGPILYAIFISPLFDIEKTIVIISD